MSNIEFGDKGKLGMALAGKFGDKYLNAQSRQVGDYWFYDDLFDGQGEVVASEADLLAISRILKRYGIKQEDIRGLGKIGSVLCCALSRGWQVDDMGLRKCYATRILVNKYSVGDEIKYSFELDGRDDFGMDVLNDGMVKHVLDISEKPVVTDNSELGSAYVNNMVIRLDKFARDRFSTFENKMTWEKEIKAAVFNWEKSSDIDRYVWEVMGTLGVVELAEAKDNQIEEVEGYKSVKREGQDAISSIQRSLEYISRREKFNNDEVTWNEILDREPEMRMVDKLVMQIGSMDNIYILEEDVPVLPSVYILIQWLAGREKYVQNPVEDVAEYWKHVSILKTEEVLDCEDREVLLVSGLSVDLDDSLDNWVDIPRIKKIRDVLGDRLKVFDMCAGEIRHIEQVDNNPISGDKENQMKQLKALGVFEVSEKVDLNKALFSAVLKYVAERTDSETLVIDMGEGEVEIMPEPYDESDRTDRQIAFEDEKILIDITEQATDEVSYLFRVWIKT